MSIKSATSKFQYQYRIKTFRIILWKTKFIINPSIKQTTLIWYQDYAQKGVLNSVFGVLVNNILKYRWSNSNMLKNYIKTDADIDLMLYAKNIQGTMEPDYADNANYSKVYNIKLLIIFLHELFSLNQLSQLNKKTSRRKLLANFNFFKTYYTIPVTTWSEVNRIMKIDKTAIRLFSLRSFVQKHQHIHKRINLSSIRGVAFLIYYFAAIEDNFYYKVESGYNKNLRLTLIAGFCFRVLFSNIIKAYIIEL